ncbi:MAG: hypothetical protein AB7S97_06765 [Thermoplasmata archaeon]
MIDILYNGILVAIVLIWVMSTRVRRLGRLIASLKRWGPALTVFLWAVFVVFVSWYAFNFDHFDDMHDIDEAVESAVGSVNDGVNPYEEYVVPRFKTKYRVDVDWTLGPYNYMPLDLVTYVGAEAVLGFLGSPYWFVASNMVFAGLAMLMLRSMVRVPWLSFLPLALIVTLFYSMDNASLTLFLMTGSMFALQNAKWHPEALSLVIMALAVLTKIYAAIPFLILLLFFLQSSASKRDWRRMSETLVAAGISAAVAVLVMLPFGISTVLDAAVFFHTSADSRIGTSAGGTLLSEIAFDSPYFALAGFALTAAAVVIGLWARSVNDRVMMATVTFLLVAVKSSLAPLTVAGVFLALRMRERADERAASAASSSSVDMTVVKESTKAAPADR